ncbi:MAG: phosphotransferase [Aquincola sp.]|nr:phosphotransferase [Aquincola sp.]MDH5328613.1 phosphotransferase [Aquincola sp.]
MTAAAPPAPDFPTARPTLGLVPWANPERRAAFEQWLAPLVDAFELGPLTLRAASADASFRRYLRIDSARHGSLVVMDAPPPKEDVRPFVDVAARIAAAGLHGPQVHAADIDRGFLLLEDLGQTLFLEALQAASPRGADDLMRAAIAALVQWQQHVPFEGLPVYAGPALQHGLALFPEWCVGREHGVSWTAEQMQVWQRFTQTLVAGMDAQPRITVHRDWMPRNLMMADPNPGILDFQDAAAGPIGYDIASLLRDAFLSWEEEREIDWAVRYWESARRASLPVPDDFGDFWRQLEWCGLQRHLRVLGVFCRLKHRDHKPRYAADLPRFFAYATKVAMRYRDLQPLLPLIEPLSGMKAVTVFSMR